MNTGKGTDDTSDRGKEVKTSIVACVSICSTVRALDGKECKRGVLIPGSPFYFP